MTRETKNSGIPWIGDIPESWHIAKVKDAFVRKNRKAHQENPVILSLARSGVKVRDISTNEGQIAASYYEYNPVEVDDLLLNPMDLYSGANCSISKIEGVISPAYVNLRHKKNVCPQYYDYYFKTQYWAMAFFAHGKGISYDNRWTMGLDTLLNYYIPVPTYKEQQNIANFLDEKCREIDGLLDDLDAEVKTLFDFKKSIISETITQGLNPDVKFISTDVKWIEKIPAHWKITRIKYIGKSQNGLTYSPSDVCEYNEIEDSVLVLRSSNIQNGHIVLEDNVYVKSVPESLKVKEGDIIICSRNGSANLVGKCAVIEEELNASWGAFMLCFRANCNSKYAYYLLTNTISNYKASFATTTINQLTQSVLNNMYLPYTDDVNEQKEIVAYLDAKCNEVDKAIASKQDQIETLKAYKSSLIYEYVTGKKQVAI